LGTTLLDRYTVVEIVSSGDGANVYRVAEMRPCPNCGVENEGDLTHCGFCGNALPSARTLALVERSLRRSGEIVPTSFELDGMTYAFERDAVTGTGDNQPRIDVVHAYLSDPGISRALRGEPNEDSVFALEATARFESAAHSSALYIVADGVGGAAAGEVASEMAVRVIAEVLGRYLFEPPSGGVESRNVELVAVLRAAIERANVQIVDYGRLHHIALGTTVVLALVVDGIVHFANVGDSRAYLWRNETLTQLTQDHSYVGELIRKGEITADEARVHPKRNLILKSLGDPAGVQPDIFPFEGDGLTLQADDMILLCTDGLWEMVSDEEIAGILGQSPDPQHNCAQLVRFANAAGGADNVTVLLFKPNAS
jgi:protein phosphatase